MYYMNCALADLLVWHLQKARKSTQVAWKMSAPEGWTLALSLSSADVHQWPLEVHFLMALQIHSK